MIYAKFFSEFGKITRCFVPTDRETGKKKSDEKFKIFCRWNIIPK